MSSVEDAISARVPLFRSFDEFWEHYLTQHAHPLNKALHVAGTIGAMICLVLSWSRNYWWLLAVLPVGYGAAWLGHYFIERNRPLTFTYPLWSLRADYRLVFRLLTGARR